MAKITSAAVTATDGKTVLAVYDEQGNSFCAPVIITTGANETDFVSTACPGQLVSDAFSYQVRKDAVDNDITYYVVESS